MTLFKPKTIWWPTWQGWILLVLLFGGAVLAFALNVHDFLAVTQRVADADILVVEAWVPDVVLKGAAAEYKAGGYRFVLTSDLRAPDSQSGQPEGVRTPIAMSRLEALGIPRDRIVTCSFTDTAEHRSHAMALSVRERFRGEGIAVKGINVVAPAGHARKTWLAYRRALESVAPVGIIAVLTNDYDPARWWKSSQGAKWVIANGVGWLHELVLGPRQ